MLITGTESMISLLMNKMLRILESSIQAILKRVLEKFKISLPQSLQLRFRRVMEGLERKLITRLGELFRAILVWWVLIWIRVLNKLWDRWEQLKKQRIMQIRIKNIRMLIQKMMLKIMNVFPSKMQREVNKILILMQCFSLVLICHRITLMASNRWWETL